MSSPVIQRTERAFLNYVAENRATFAALQALCPALYETLLKLNRASFYAGCTYEHEIGVDTRHEQSNLEVE